MRCPGCGHDNIAGVDLCEACGLDLAGLDLPEARSGFRGRLLNSKVSRLSLAPPLTVAPEDTVRHAIELMREARHGCVLVAEAGRLVGIFTERDVLTRVVRPGLDPATLSVAEVMTEGPMVLEPGDPPAFAVHRMVAQSCRHIPVVDGERLAGFVSARSLLRYLEAKTLGRAVDGDSGAPR